MFNSYRVTTLEYDPARCNGCGRCVEVCPHAVFRMESKRAVLSSPESCMECGACRVNCPQDAIHVESGVGCATAMILAALRGSKEKSCGDTSGDCCGGSATSSGCSCN